MSQTTKDGQHRHGPEIAAPEIRTCAPNGHFYSPVVDCFHDMFLPFDYRRDWTIGENRNWNEQYLLQALLQFSSGYRILFGCNYAFYRFRNEIINVINHPNGHGFGGGSFYFQKT